MSATTLHRPAAPTAARPVAPLNDQEVQAYLRTGLRNRWWPLLPSRFIGAGAKPLGLVRLGEKLVVWRDTAGAVHVQRDRCPHRAVPLSRGMNEGDRLRCIYHGVEIGPDGTVLNVPGQPGCPLEGKKAVRTFPSREIAGAIFAWFGDDLHQEPAPFDPPVELVGEEYSNFCCYADWAAPWRCVYDNLMDPMHGTFLHADSHTMYQGRDAGELRHPRHADRLLLREGRPARRELRLERAGRQRRLLCPAGNPLPSLRRTGRELRHRLHHHADR